ncbi:hypothetical protein [Aliihoeflea sp. 2WW]|uniref:hypothetical protein n=1 Tax=Aliihoeflea sp. 2WW TaxID=1381123 RepID=UPI001267FEA2|nr:hypothetical protein [Aliihoeflea sp. 2WW]
MTIVLSRFAWCAIARIAVLCGAAAQPTEGGRDKKPHIAARSGGCCCGVFRDFARIADQAREVRGLRLFNGFSETRTSQRKSP